METGGLNSTMVRLKPVIRGLQIKQVLMSQFHYGSIKTHVVSFLAKCKELVSIPLWFD